MEDIQTPSRAQSTQEYGGSFVTLVAKGDSIPEISIQQRDVDMQVAKHEAVTAIMWGQPTNEHGQKIISAHQLIETYLRTDRFVAGRFCGRFAFLLWDGRRKRLIIATDRLARCKLFYRLETAKNGCWRLRVATRPKILAEASRASIDARAIRLFLSMGVVPVPLTIWEGIESIPPATMILFENNQWVRKNYWQPRFAYLEHGEAEPSITELQAKLNDWVAQFKKQQALLWLQGTPLDKILLARLATAGVYEPLTISISDNYTPPKALQALSQRHGGQHQHIPLTAETLLMQLEQVSASFLQPVADITAVHAYLAQAAGRHANRNVATTMGIDALLAGGPVFSSRTSLVKQLLQRFGGRESARDGLARYLQMRLSNAPMIEVDDALDWLRPEGERWLRHIKATSVLDQMIFLDWVWRWSSGVFQSEAVIQAFADRDGTLQQSMLSDEWLQWSCQIPATLKRQGQKSYAILHDLTDGRFTMTTAVTQQWPKLQWKLKKTGLMPQNIKQQMKPFLQLDIDTDYWLQWIEKFPRNPGREHSIHIWRLLILSAWLKHNQ